MDRFVAAGSQNRRAQDLLRLRVHQYLHEALRFALLDGAADLCHRARADESASATLADFRLRHPGPPERRVDIEAVRQDAVTDAAAIVVEKICRDNLKIVV